MTDDEIGPALVLRGPFKVLNVAQQQAGKILPEWLKRPWAIPIFAPQ